MSPHTRSQVIIPHCQTSLRGIILVILLTPDIVISALIYVIVLTFLQQPLGLISLLVGLLCFTLIDVPILDESISLPPSGFFFRLWWGQPPSTTIWILWISHCCATRLSLRWFEVRGGTSWHWRAWNISTQSHRFPEMICHCHSPHNGLIYLLGPVGSKRPDHCSLIYQENNEQCRLTVNGCFYQESDLGFLFLENQTNMTIVHQKTLQIISKEKPK